MTIEVCVADDRDHNVDYKEIICIREKPIAREVSIQAQKEDGMRGAG